MAVLVGVEVKIGESDAVICFNPAGSF